MSIAATRYAHPLPLVAALGAVAGWTALAWGQVAPEGVHTSVGPGAGLTSYGSPTGGFAASIPLDLPDPRGPLPVPVSVVYTGSARAGAAGAGWDVPLTFVRRQVSTWRRRPRYFDIGGTGEAAERIQLAMNGSPQLMVPHGSVFVPHAGGQYVELSRNGSGWRARTLDNLEYVFTPASAATGGIADPDLWLLTEIRDMVGTDRVTLRYGATGLDLVNVAYTYGDADKTPLYEIDLVHESFNGVPFEFIREDGTAFSRSRVLSRIEVRARDNHALIASPKIIRAYHLTYGVDPDTTKPRLSTVTMTGEEGVPGAAVALPVATYAYGSLTPSPTADIHVGPGEVIARNLPASYGANLATTTNVVQDMEEEEPQLPPPGFNPAHARRETSTVRHMLRDFTGDGLPDLVYKEGATWKLVANRLDAAGEPHLDGQAMTWTDSTGPAELHLETSFRFVPPTTTVDDNEFTGGIDEAHEARKAMITTETWTTFVDWNGDGRLDIVDTRGGRQDIPDHEGEYWRVWLNSEAADGSIVWRPVQIHIARIRGHLDANGFEQLDESTRFPDFPWDKHLPLARSRSWPRVKSWTCRAWQCTGATASQPGQCTQVEDCAPDSTWGPLDGPVQVDTMSEWSLVDKNGDGYPDIVALTLPVRECERNPNGFTGPGDQSVDPWRDRLCPDQTPTECLGFNLVDGYYTSFKEHHEKITSSLPGPGDWNGKCGAGPAADSRIAVFLNRQGPFVGLGDSPFALPTEAAQGAPAGLEHWTTGATSLYERPEPAEGVSWHASGLLDSFGGGELTFHARQTIQAQVDTAIFKTNRHEKCHPTDPHPVPFTSLQTGGEADLNGDGLADHIFSNAPPGSPTSNLSWYVRFNTGIGWGPPRQILANGFAISEAGGVCTGDAQTAAGLTDLDGDGIPELLRVSNGVLYRTKFLTTPYEVGRLTRIGNGYGATTYIQYANGKADTFTPHAVPFPEVVVAETGTRVNDGGHGISPVFYAYGTARLNYEPLAGQWSFSGYRRVVAMTGTLDASGATGLVGGIAVITDRGGPASPGSSWAEHVTAQQVTRTRYVEGAFQPNSIQSLLVGDPLAFAETTAQHAGHQMEPSVGGIPNPDCADLEPVLGIPAGTGRCGSAGIAFTARRQAWEGLAAPPSQSNTLAGSTTDEVDTFGRPTRLSNAGDLRRTDDDVCTTLTYASPPSGGAFPSVPSAMAVSDCGWGNPVGGNAGTPRLLSVVRFFYDEQPHGSVVKGRLTSRQVDRYGPNGYLDTNTVDRMTYDVFGEIATVTTERALGSAATHAVTMTRDVFGATVTSATESASDVGQVFTTSSRLSSWPTVPSQSVDHTGLATHAQHDRFGRKVLSWVDTGTHKSILSRTIYNDAPSGRAVTVETFPGDTAPNAMDSTADKQRSHVVIDALGRARFTLRELGADYGGARIVADLADYDALGRVSFVASPFVTDENPFVPDPAAELFGTSAVFDRRGRVVRQVTAHGPQPERTETSVPENVFVRTFQRHYENGQAITATTGADENDPDSDNRFALDVVSRTAIGRELRRARYAPGGARIDLVDQEWDRLGRVAKLRRYLNPQLGTAAIVWQSEFDSLGRRLTLSEPGTSTRHSRYDESGNEIESWWQDGARRQVTRARYDGFGRLVSRTMATVANNGGEQIRSRDRFHYDQHSGQAEQPAGELLGRLSWAETQGVGAVFYGYDQLGRSASSSYLYTGHDQLVRESTQQAPGGRLESLTLATAYGTDVISYGYDSADRMRQVRRGGSLLVDAQDVDAKGRYRRVVYGNGAVEGFDYAPFGREELLSWGAPGHIFEYLEIDGAGRLRFERDQDLTAGETTFFGYEHDALGRLTTMAKSTGGLPGVEAYTHDPLGNLLSRTATTGVPDLVYQRDPADPDRMCRISAPGSSGACQFRYDGAGNVAFDRSGPVERRFEYDPGQRIQRIARGDNQVRLDYGPVGRAHTDVRTPAGRRRAWHFGLVEERWLPGRVVHVERKIPGPLGVNVSLRTAIVNNGAPTNTIIYAHGDGRGNRVFTGDGGAIVQAASYGTFGQTTTTASGTAITQTDDLWNGGDNLPEVGLVLLGPRAYDPNLGRFLQRDPLSIAMRSSNANPYAFAFSNPVDFADPTGLWPGLNIFARTPGDGPDRTNPWVVAGLAVGFAVTELNDHYLSPLAAVGAAGFDASPSGMLSYLRNQQTRCGGACEFGRDAGAAASATAGAYVDYTKGKFIGIAETVEEVGGVVEDAAWRGVKGPIVLIGENLYNAPETIRSLARSGDAIGHAVTADPWGTVVDAACRSDGCGFDDYSRNEVKIAVAVAGPGAGQKAAALAEDAVRIGARLARRLKETRGLKALTERAGQVHAVLDPIAQAQRTTTALRTTGGDIIAGGARDLTPAQRAALGPGEVAAKLPGAHAEVTALSHAAAAGFLPEAMAVTRTICPYCAGVIEASGGTLTSPTTAVWRR